MENGMPTIPFENRVLMALARLDYDKPRTLAGINLDGTSEHHTCLDLGSATNNLRSICDTLNRLGYKFPITISGFDVDTGQRFVEEIDG